MYKLLFIFFMFVSSPLYSNEFKYHCDEKDNNLTIVFDVNRSEKSIVHTHSINKKTNTVSEVNRTMKIYDWDETKDSVWTILDDPHKLTLSLILFNFQHQKLVSHTILNTFDDSNDDTIDDIVYSRLFKCYII
ncbi:hypothetical protein OAC62_05710 [Amylibacter sp.]|nr:hypothetical protein [Amylibacter sp.]